MNEEAIRRLVKLYETEAKIQRLIKVARNSGASRDQLREQLKKQCIAQAKSPQDSRRAWSLILTLLRAHWPI